MHILSVFIRVHLWLNNIKYYINIIFLRININLNTAHESDWSRAR